MVQIWILINTHLPPKSNYNFLMEIKQENYIRSHLYSYTKMGSKHSTLVYVRRRISFSFGASMHAGIVAICCDCCMLAAHYVGLCLVGISANKMFRADACVLWTKVLWHRQYYQFYHRLIHLLYTFYRQKSLQRTSQQRTGYLRLREACILAVRPLKLPTLMYTNGIATVFAAHSGVRVEVTMNVIFLFNFHRKIIITFEW